ncbi:MAG: aromatic amino acid transport family protein, partial [Nanoarchaeota archaeon]
VPRVCEGPLLPLGTLEMILVWGIVLLITLYLAEIVLRTKGDHEVTGLAEKYLGKKGKLLLVVVGMLYIYGALLAYSVGLGEAVYGLIGTTHFGNSIIFFIFLAAVVFFGLKVVTKAEVFLTPFIFLIIIVLFFYAFDKIDTANYTGYYPDNLLVPLGPLFFALLGFWCVPDMKRIIKDNKKLKNTIIIGVTLIAMSYLLLILVVVGVSGEDTTQLFSIGLTQYVNHGVGKLVHLFTIFTLTTSFVGLGFTLKEIYELDYGWSNTAAWCVTFVVPFGLLFFIKRDFLSIISITGAVASVFVVGILIMMFHKAKKKGNRKPEFSLPVPLWLNILILLFCVIIAVQTVWMYVA